MGFFDDSDDDDDPAPAQAPAPAPAPPAPPATAPTVSALRDPSDLPRVSIMDRLAERSTARSTLPPAPMAAPPTPPPAVPRELQRKPFDDEEEAAEEVVEQRSSGAGSSNVAPTLADILSNYEANTNPLFLEAVRKGKEPMRSAAKGAPSGVGTADKGKRPRPIVRNLEDLEKEALEKEALACGSGDDEEEDDDEEATLRPPHPPPPRPPSPTPARPGCRRSPFSSGV